MTLSVKQYNDNPDYRTKIVTSDTIVQNKMIYICRGVNPIVFIIPNDISFGSHIQIIGGNNKYTVISDNNAKSIIYTSDVFQYFIGKPNTSIGILISTDIIIEKGIPTCLTSFKQGEHYGYQISDHSTSNDKFSFTTEVVANISITFPVLPNHATAGHYNRDYGYVTNGANTPSTTTTTKLLFSADSPSTSTISLSVPRIESGSFSSYLHGYTLGGATSGYSGYWSTIITPSNVIDKFLFSTEATATNIGTLDTQTTGYHGIISYEHGAGYKGGGTDNTLYYHLTTINKIQLVTDTVSGYAHLALGKTGISGLNDIDYGFFCGGFRGSFQYYSDIEQFIFATEANSILIGNLDINRAGAASNSSGTTGYAVCGAIADSTVSNTVSEFKFSTHNVSAMVARMNSITMNSVATQY